MHDISLRQFAHVTEWIISLQHIFFLDSDLSENHVSLSKVRAHKHTQHSVFC